MKTSESIKEISKALLKAQTEMSNAKKGATNPFFKSKYADLNSIREACQPVLNENRITILQPTIEVGEKKYVETVLIHESGEFLSCVTEILINKVNDAQAQGSGISYARRYGLQSFLNIGADDDDGNKAVEKLKENLCPQHDKWVIAIEKLKAKETTIEKIKANYTLTKENELILINKSK